MSWRAVDDELLNLQRLVRTMEEEEEGQLAKTMEEEEGQLVRTMEEGQLARTMEVEEEVRPMRKMEEEEEGQLVRTIEEEGEGQLPVGPHSRSGDELKIKETGTENGKDLSSFLGGSNNENRPSVLGGKDGGQRSSYHPRKGEDPRSPDPLPVSRLLDELKHFDKDKGLRKVKIEISLEDRGWGESSLRRRLSESSLENNEAVRSAVIQLNVTIFKDFVCFVRVTSETRVFGNLPGFL